MSRRASTTGSSGVSRTPPTSSGPSRCRSGWGHATRARRVVDRARPGRGGLATPIGGLDIFEGLRARPWLLRASEVRAGAARGSGRRCVAPLVESLSSPPESDRPFAGEETLSRDPSSWPCRPRFPRRQPGFTTRGRARRWRGDRRRRSPPRRAPNRGALRSGSTRHPFRISRNRSKQAQEAASDQGLRVLYMPTRRVRLQKSWQKRGRKQPSVVGV
jgi:hypothetical protein